MARTYVKTKPSVKAQAKPASGTEEKMQEVPENPKDAVITAPEGEVMKTIVYQPSAQILTREAGPNESFGVGDDMPIYYL